MVTERDKYVAGIYSKVLMGIWVLEEVETLEVSWFMSGCLYSRGPVMGKDEQGSVFRNDLANGSLSIGQSEIDRWSSKESLF